MSLGSFVGDLSWCLESRSDAEMPERLLGGATIVRIDAGATGRAAPAPRPWLNVLRCCDGRLAPEAASDVGGRREARGSGWRRVVGRIGCLRGSVEAQGATAGRSRHEPFAGLGRCFGRGGSGGADRPACHDFPDSPCTTWSGETALIPLSGLVESRKALYCVKRT